MPAEIIPLGSRLRQRREALGLSQAQVARELDVARTAYRLWELDAARPSPDRWRAIAGWLGISMSAMLLAGELLSEQEADQASETASAAGMTTLGWDARSGESAGDYFSQQRSMIDDQVRAGTISPGQATDLGVVLDRLQHVASAEAAGGWFPGRFRKRFVCDPLAPGLARAAVATTAVGIPAEALTHAMLLTSELVTNSVRHSGSPWVQVDVTVDADRLRVEVSDQSPAPPRPRTPDANGGWGMTLVAVLATSWGVDRAPTGKTIWIEFALAPESAGASLLEKRS